MAQYIVAYFHILLTTLRNILTKQLVYRTVFHLTSYGNHSHSFIQTKEAVARRCSVKKMFLKIKQSSQERTCTRVSFLIKLHSETSNFILKKSDSKQRCFPVDFAKVLRAPFL